ncbi:MAG: CxxxxCH/CxxCH domain-containing protein [Bacteroidetes bacterium]|jgi:predicted CxxxxCH...CXXCH cytochrome family protein|nr:CxxxxCH/CxxCH domain-containing protein [Bacteroidota bacterium]MCL5034948.1 CxxxxCH/CxxCH domain-containing protein [Bacteroidota bacterium]
MKKHIEIILAIAVGFAFSSCSKLQNNVLAPASVQDVVHPAGWTDLNSSEFHGTYIKQHNYDLATCASCHGADYRGGISGKSCYTCHEETNGPLACNTCHGSLNNAAPPPDLSGNTSTTDPGVGAHQSHLAGNSYLSSVACSSCHVVPQAAGPGIHPFGTQSALVAFSGVATTETNTPGSRFYDSTQPTVVPQPMFNQQTLECSNTYCHGDFKNGNNYTPTWNKTTSGQAACGTCHGIPPNTPIHRGQTMQTCYLCHEPMIGPNGVIQDSSLHVNGKLELYGKSLSVW